VVIREGQNCSVSVFGMFDAGMVVVALAIVMRRIDLDEVPVDQRLPVGLVRVRKRQQADKDKSQSGHHRSDASGQG
jgi:hypothetical protein